jgi:putative two-component system response regulator
MALHPGVRAEFASDAMTGSGRLCEERRERFMRALIVDDDEISLEILENVLSEMGYQVERALNGKEALTKLRRDPIHLVITDWEMPEMNGLELCRAIREEDFEGYVFIIMLTSRDGGQQKIDGIHGGADAFLVKPLNPEELLVSLKTAERILSLETRDLAMFALAKLSESRDPETGAHIERVQSYARLLAQHLSTTDRYGDLIDTEFVRLIYQTSPLHDIGKVGIPDSVLLKPGKLDGQEMSVMRTHAELGAQTLEASLQRFPNVRFLQMARDIAMSHHEHWDGKGYPKGLAGEAIPLAGRIVALADVYDALTSRRVYREALSHAQAKTLILLERGAHFDPDVIDAFLAIEPQFVQIRERFRDDERQAEPELTKAAVQEQQNKVLVADDDPVVRDLLTNFLNRQGVECVIAADGEEALELFDAQSPNLIISDWAMPGIDGLELCRRVRSRSRGSHVHFIMLTMHADEIELTKAFDAGVDDFLAKPFNSVAMMARLRAGLRAVALHDELTKKHQGSRQLNEQLTNLNHRLEKLAITDDLTGLYNRRQAMHRLEEHWAMCDRYQRPLAVVSLDIDHFKQINDRYGHSAGDAVLREVADILRECIRSTDSVCRIGGEEFLVLLPFQTLQEAEICAQRCRQAVSIKQFKSGTHRIQATISAGIASRRSGIVQFADLLKEADEALYLAKGSGRNCVRSMRHESGGEKPAATAA